MTKRRANGEGTIYQRSDGRWHAQLRLPNSKRKNIYGDSQKEVVQALSRLRKEVDAGLHASLDAEQTLRQFSQGWIAGRKHKLRSKTMLGYESMVKNHLDFIGDIPLSKLTAHTLQKHYTAKLQVFAATTIHHLHAFLHVVLDHAVRLELIPKNPTDYVDAPGIHTAEIRPLTEQQIKQLLIVLQGDRYEALYFLAVATGMREAELLGLRWQDVQLRFLTVRVAQTLHRLRGRFVLEEPKSRMSRRTLPLPSAAAEILVKWSETQEIDKEKMGAAWGENWGLVFTTPAGQPLHYSQALAHFRLLLEKAGLPLSTRLHDLRHTFATLLLERGVHIKAVSELLGHSSVNITLSIYGHVTRKMQDTAVVELDNILRLDSPHD
ncbi:MAG: site-specific integrase [Ktedonobacterales bacterium]|nr:site-specific integrase [Ktedonobacterales bacterium]